jgi:predicted nucleotidyltransferase
MVNKMVYHSGAARLFLGRPDGYFTAADVSRALGMPYATAWRCVRILKGAGVVRELRVGRAWAYRLNAESPFLGRLEAMLRGDACDSPHMVVAKEFVRRARKLKNIRRIVLFGSVSRGEERPGSDVDLVVVPERAGKKAEDAVGDITLDVIDKSGIALTPLLMSEKELKEDRQFESEIKNGVVMYDRSHEGREGGGVLAGCGKVPHGKRR